MSPKYDALHYDASLILTTFLFVFATAAPVLKIYLFNK